MLNKPFVSIAIPAYNASEYLAEAIESALAQTYESIEILVINDGSKDNGATEKISLEYSKRFPNKVFYYYKDNGGCASALNYGMEVMNGDYYSWLSHDDLYLPEKVSALMGLISQYKIDQENTVLGCNDLILGTSGKMKKNIFNNTTGLLTPEKAFDENLNIKTINGCSLLIPRHILEVTGKFRTDYKHLLDREYWMRIALNGFGYCFADQPYAISRVHNAQITVKAQDSLYSEEAKLIDEYAKLAESANNMDFLRSLCYFAYKRKHYIQGKRLKQTLLNNGVLDCATKKTIIKYNLRGRLRRIFRNAYKKMIRR